LLDGAVLYSHNGSLSPRDTLALSVEAGPVHTDTTLQVTIALESPLAPLQLVQHKKIYVFQGEAAEIRRDHLEVKAGLWGKQRGPSIPAFLPSLLCV
jgi:chondroitin sulfate proteoglycan 4